MVCSKVPLYAQILPKQIAEYFPHHSQSVTSYQRFIGNILKVTEYAQNVRNDIILIILEQIRKMDAELEVKPEDDEDNEVEDDSQLDEQQLFYFDESINTSVNHDNNVLLAEKLDTAMALIFQYIKSIESNLPVLNEVFKTVLQNFGTGVLNTKQLHTTQFVMFLICSLNVRYQQTFLEFLLKKVFDEKCHMDVRVACTAYTASFLSRANYISTSILLKVLTAVLQALQQYIKTCEEKINMIDISTHRMFYIMCECVFYVLCYKTPMLMKEQEGSKFLMSSVEILARIVKSKFAPFKVC
jgi:RNA polymerase I-specific transcription initiation factor RRN3